ncbi:MAG: type II toxin-antitoxin system RelE/ParE family toxin [Candidatus Eremiobacteraeota bacterium]|nr:type II toxin-antitoxin system RelE/ParE family toxin [Candidatus Eremiobacteraeota bacterium]
MHKKCNLWYLIRGSVLRICWLELNQKYDYEPFFDSLTNREQKKVLYMLNRITNFGVNWSQEKCKKIDDRIFEIKAGQIRIPFFYHKKYRNYIVITHMFRKKQDEWPPGELNRANKRMKIAETLKPMEPQGGS